MADQLPDPLVPANVDLQDFRFMPLDVVRLRDSGMAAQASGEGFRAGVLLWCVAWHQVPAGSLPDDDLTLAGYAGFGRSVRDWRKHRHDALRGWVKCADGRLYHPVVCEKVREAHEQKLRHMFRSECSRIKKAAERSKVSPVYPSYDEWEAHYKVTSQKAWKPLDTPNTRELSRGTDAGQPAEDNSPSPAIPPLNRIDRTGPDRTGPD